MGKCIGKMTLESYMISGIKWGRYSEGWYVLLRLRAGGHLVFKCEKKEYADIMVETMKKVWRGEEKIEVSVILGGEEDG